MSKIAIGAALLSLTLSVPCFAQQDQDAKINEFRAKLRALDWQAGPRTLSIPGNSTLTLPDGYVYLDAANTAKFEELNQNLSSGKEVMLAPKSLRWTAYLIFDDEGYVKDDEKIDADAILKTLKEGTESANEERRRRGWSELHVTGWSIPPAYNKDTKRLEWATQLRSQNGEGSNFFTKILGRKGFTTVVLVSDTDQLSGSVQDLDKVLTAYRFNAGDTYAEYRPGDKVAEYGLAGLIVGGAVAAAVKTGLLKGLWKFIVTAAVAGWKLIVAGALALMAGIKSFFKRKQAEP